MAHELRLGPRVVEQTALLAQAPGAEDSPAQAAVVSPHPERKLGITRSAGRDLALIHDTSANVRVVATHQI